MNALNFKYLLIGLALFVAAAGGMALKPTKHTADQGQKIDLEAIIPRNFGTWSLLQTDVVSVINPQQQEVLDRIYSQVVTRSYRDSQTGQIVMLSIAYGEEQSKQSQVHLPEICYPAQGFQITGRTKDVLNTPEEKIPVMRLVAILSARQEPITYWIRLGDQIVRGGLEQKIATVREGLAGRVSDGLLFRISSIETDFTKAYLLHDRFVGDLLRTIPPSSKRLLIGQQVRSQ